MRSEVEVYISTALRPSRDSGFVRTRSLRWLTSPPHDTTEELVGRYHDTGGTSGSARLLLRGGARLVSTCNADVAQLVEHHLAMVRVAGSNPVVRSKCRPLQVTSTPGHTMCSHPIAAEQFRQVNDPFGMTCTFGSRCDTMSAGPNRPAFTCARQLRIMEARFKMSRSDV